MSVYTCIEQPQLEHFLSHYAIGQLINYSGILAGIENTNYLLHTSEGRYVLTIFESLSVKQLPFYLDLLNFLHQQRYPAPRPILNDRKQFLTTLNNKPAAIFQHLPGHSIGWASENQCQQIGIYLAKLHLLANDSGFKKNNNKGLAACQSTFNRLENHLSIHDRASLKKELSIQQHFQQSILPDLDLPRGVIHADLFKDNVLFDQNSISGILDFYNACTDYLLLDIAITVNDWCQFNKGIDPSRLNALLTGYQSIRPLSDTELAHLPMFLRFAAMRFCLSRLDHYYNPKPGDLTLQKDPGVFAQILKDYQAKEVVSELCIPA